jgi:hypothetical protein
MIVIHGPPTLAPPRIGGHQQHSNTTLVDALSRGSGALVGVSVGEDLLEERNLASEQRSGGVSKWPTLARSVQPNMFWPASQSMA